jgi:hypothetical protein
LIEYLCGIALAMKKPAQRVLAGFSHTFRIV